MSNKRPSNNNRDLVAYASLGTQLLAALALAVFAGLKLDQWLKISPALTCALPLITLIGIFYKITRDTKPPKDEK